MFYILYPDLELLFWLLTIAVTLLYIVLIPAHSALAETLHMAVCIQLGKSDFVKGIVVTYISTKKNHWLFMNSVVTKFRGMLSPSERIQIHGASPLITLLLLALSFRAVMVYTNIPARIIMGLWIFLAISPVGSLIPHRIVTDSDGYCIVRYARSLKYSWFLTMKELLSGVFIGLRYIFIGSCCVKKYDASDIIYGELIRAYELVQKGNFRDALPILEKELYNQPDNPELLNNIAWCYAEIGINFDRAIELVNESLHLDPSEALYHDTLAWCYYKKGNIDRALDCALSAIKIEPDNILFQGHLKIIKGEKNS